MKILPLVLLSFFLFSELSFADTRLPRADICYKTTNTEKKQVQATSASDFPNLSIYGDGSGKARGVYDEDNGIVCGSISKGIFTGVWAETHSSQKCATQKLGSYYWGSIRVVTEPNSPQVRKLDWDYCKTALPKLPKHYAITERLPKGAGIITPIKNKWIKDMTPAELKEARAQNCSCETITLGRVTYMPTASTNAKRKRLYDLHDGPRPNPIPIPVLRKPEWTASDTACFSFTFPKKMTYMSKADQAHFCNTVVEVNYPHTLLGGGGGTTQTAKLFNAGGMGGGVVFTVKGPDGRFAVYNMVCLVNPINHEEIGPAGAKGTIKWSVRRASNMDGGFKQETCGSHNFIMK